MNFEAFHDGVTNRVIGWNGLVPNPSVTGAFLNMAFENKTFTPPSTGVWGRLTIQNSDGIVACLGSVPHTRDLGAVVIQVFDRQGAGTKAMKKFMDGLRTLLEYYKVGGLELLQGSPTTVGADGNGFYQINLRFEFRAG